MADVSSHDAVDSVDSVGRSIPRVDGRAKVTGTAKYLDDIVLPGMIYGATVRSTMPHAVLDSIELDPDYDFTEVTVVTAADIPGKNYVALIEEDQPVLVPVGGTIRHVDEPVALVAAKTLRKAREAAKHIRLSVTERPAVLSMEDAIAADTAVHGTDNVYKKFLIEKGGGIEAALASADHVVEGTYRTQAQEQMYIEPQGMIARFDDDGTMRITGSLQCPYYVHGAMGPIFDLPDDKVIIAQSVTGGGFGGKEEYPSMIAAHAGLLSLKAGVPVKLIYDREEDIAATTKRHPCRVVHRLGFMNDGTLVACDVDVVMDCGAYATLSAVVLSRGVLHAAGPYSIPNIRIRGRGMATNYPPHGAFRGFGAPQTTFAYERQIQKAARILGRDPFDYRRQVLLREGMTTATSQVLTHSVASMETLEAVENAAKRDVRHSRATRDVTPSGLVKRGRGLCTYYHGAGFTGSGEQRLAGQATVALLPSGTFEVRSSSTDIGQGVLTMFSQIAATALGVSVGMIHVPEPSTDHVPDSGPTVASRTCMVVGSLVERASQGLRSRITAWATESGVAGDFRAKARAMGESAGEITETRQYEPPPGIEWDDDTYTGSAYPVYGWAACLVDVAVDMDTYEVTVERCIQAVDVGKAINPVVVKGQIEGGTVQALGWALLEDVVYKDGRVANRRMTNCIIPTFEDAPELETFIVEKPYPFGPHGAKGVGEIPMDGPAAAVAGALEDALGVAFDFLPVSPETIERAVGGDS